MKKFVKLFLGVFILTFFVSCIEDNIPRNRPDLDIGELGTDVDPDEIDVIEEIEDNSTKRPDQAIIINSDHCACADGKSIGIGNCASTCQSKSTAQTKQFFFNVKFSAQFFQDGFEDVHGFCSTQENEPNAGCEIEVKAQNGSLLPPLEIVPAPGQTSFSIDIGALPERQTLRLAIIERSSGAKSTSVQLKLGVNEEIDVIGSPLALMPINEYTCMLRSNPPSFDPNDGSLLLDIVNRFHFYFIPESRPEPLQQASLPLVYCHDLEVSPSIPLSSPLLEETTGVFTLWNKSDPRFFDLDANKTMKINEIIEANIELQGIGVNTTPDLFFPLNFPSGFNDGDVTAGSEATDTSVSMTSSTLGFAMTPFIDDRTFKAFCPTREHYYSSSPIFKAMREVISVDTEGLYAAKQENICDFILLKQSLLEKIWFYKEGGKHIKPTDSTILGKQIQFYWPADIKYPHVKKSHQRTYTLKSADELNSPSNCGTEEVTSSTQNSDGVKTSFPPHDKRLGCIPVLAD